MYPTASQKEQYLMKYDRLIWETIRRFKRRCSSSFFFNEEDLYQECIVFLLDYLQRSNDPHRLKKVPVKDMVHAMCCYILNTQPVKFTKRTTDFSSHIHSMSPTKEYESAEMDLLDESIDDVLFHIDFERFVSQLPEVQQQVVALKRTNLTNRETARTLGISDVLVTRSLRRVQRSFQAYNAV